MSTLSVTTINTANGTTNLTLATGNTSASKITVTSAGLVGIANTNPGQSLTVGGTIESTTGGFKFPDGSTQTAAALTVNYYSQLFTSNGSWTAPAGVIKVKAWLIGGGGGGSYNGYYGAGNMGGFGGFCIGTYTVSPGTTYTVTVGVAGTGVTGSTSGNVTGNAGGYSSFGALATATGGSGAPSGSAGSDITPGADGSSSSGTLRNGNMNSMSFAMTPFISAGRDYNSTATTSAITTWTTSTIAYPGAAGYYYGSIGTGGISGIVYLEWVG